MDHSHSQQLYHLIDDTSIPNGNGVASHSGNDDTAHIVDPFSSAFANGSSSSAPQNNEKRTQIDFSSEDLFPALPVSAAAANPPAQAWRPAVQKLSSEPAKKLVGSGKRVAESFEISSKDLKQLPSTGKDSLNDHAKAIGLRTQTTVEVIPSNVNRSYKIVITGKPESVKLARKDLISAIGRPAIEIVKVPSSVRPHILGAGGNKLKDITARTNTRIEVPKASKPVDGEIPAEDIDDVEHEVKITGNFEGVAEAKKEIEAIVKERTESYSLKLQIDRLYHPFIAGANNARVKQIEAETNVKVHLPPFFTAPSNSTDKKEEQQSQKNPNEVVLKGTREACKAVEAQLRQLHEDLQRTTRTLSFAVKKRQHRFIIGTKGKNLQEILESTGCSVELPHSTDPNDHVTVRGPDGNLHAALQIVLQKANQVNIEEIHVTQSLPPSTNPAHFLRYLFTKELAQIQKIEASQNVSIHRMLDNPADPLIEIQGKDGNTKLETQAAHIQLSALVQECGRSLFFGVVEVPHGLHRFVVGKSGANIAKMKAAEEWGGRLADVLVPSESEGSDEILVVVRRLPRGLGSSSGVKPSTKKPAGAAKAEADDDEEVTAFAEKVRAAILNESLAHADFASEVVPVPSKFHGRLIGKDGKDLKELLAPFKDEVSIRFPSAAATKDDKNNKNKVDPETVVVKGPKKLVAECKTKLAKVLAELKRIETLASYTDTLKVKKGTGKKLRDGAGNAVSANSSIVHETGKGDSIGWLVRLLKDTLQANPPKSADAVTAENHHMLSLLKVEVAESAGDDVLTFTGPKDVVALAKQIIADRAARLANQVSLEFKVFQSCSIAAKAVLEEGLVPDLKNRVMRKLIGQKGRNVKALMDKYSVAIQFPEGGKPRSSRKAGKNADAEDEGDEPATEAVVEDVEPTAVVDGLVVVKGNPKDTEAVKADIMKIVESEIVNSFTTSFEVPRSALPHILGAAGSKIKALREAHNIRIDLTDVEDDAVLVTLEGAKAACTAVFDKINGFADEITNVETRHVPVPYYLHKDIIGAGGSRIKPVIDSFGGQDKVKIDFPPKTKSVVGNAESNLVSIKAHVSQIDSLQEALVNLVNEVLAGEDESSSSAEEALTLLTEETEGTVTKTITIPSNDISRVLGKGGDTVKYSMRKFKVVYWFSEPGADSVEVKVVGTSEEDVDKAIADVQGKLFTTRKVPLPANVRENLATAGEVHNEEAASVQELVKGVRAQSNAGSATAEISSNSLSGSADAFILVRGDTKAVERAVKKLEKDLESLGVIYEATERIPIDSSVIGRIIGSGGSRIEEIRKQSQASVEVKKGAGRGAGDVVVIRGTADAVAAAVKTVQGIIDTQQRIAREDAVKKAQQPAKSTFSGRLDDENELDNGSEGVQLPAANSTPAFVPGFVQKAKGTKAAVPVTVASSAPTYYASFSSAPKVEESWKPVAAKKASKKGDEEEAAPVPASAATAEVVPGSGPSKKKKKNKKTANGAVPAGGTEEVEEKVSVPVAAPVAAVPVRAPSPARVPASAPVKAASAPARAASPAKAVAPSLAPIAAVVSTAIPVAKDIAVPAQASAPVDDGWTVIPKKSGAAASAAALESSGEAAKKKKKRNKKKKAASGVNDNGDEDEADDE